MADNIIIDASTILSEDYHTLKKISFRRINRKGEWQSESKEVYYRGDAATVLLYNPSTKMVVLTSQFRLPTFLNDNATGMLIETCAGKLEDESPETGIRRETEEETGYRIENFTALFSLYMSAGSLTEKMYFFSAVYSENDKVSAGGGLDSEKEDITVFEVPFEEALNMVTQGEIMDGKTVILLQYAQINKLMH